MKINSITLTDYRNHIGENRFEFTNGINLLLGKNGSGKSSILEAIGLALFNTGNRTTNYDAINFNAKTATINVEFEGIDGNEYIVEKKLGSSTGTKLFKKGDKSSRVEGKPAEEKIKLLAGIESNAQNIYENIITAYQNKITGVFLENNKTREKIFNEIFDTEIYRDIYEKFSKNAEDKYNSLKLSKNTLLVDKQANIKDNELLNNDLQNVIEIQNNAIKRSNAIKNLITQIESEEKFLQEIKNSIGNKTIELKSKHILKEKNVKSMEEARLRLTNSEKALDIVTNNKNIYKTYIKYLSESKLLSKQIDDLEVLEKEKLNFERDINLMSNKITKLTEHNEANRLSIKEKNEQLNKYNEEIDNLNSDLIKEKESQENINLEINSYASHQENYNKLLIKLNEFQDKNNQLSIITNEKHKSLIDIPQINTEILNLQNSIKEFESKIIEKKLIEQRINEFNARLNDNNDAKEVLSNGICPYLKEECFNLKQGSSAEEFFNNKAYNLKIELDNSKQLLEQYSDIEKLKRNSEKKLTELNKSLKDNDKSLNEIKEYEHKIKYNNKDIEILELKLFSFIKNIKNEFLNVEFPNIQETKEFKAINDFFNAKISELKAIYKSKNDKITELEKNSKKLNDDKLRLQTNIKELQNSVINNDKELLNLKANTNKLKNEIAKIELEIDILPDLKIKRSDINLELDNNKQGYELYISNEKSSNEINLHKNKITDIEKNNTILIEEIGKLQIDIEELSEKYSDKKLQEVIANLKQNREEEKLVLMKISEFKVTIKNINESIIKNNQLLSEIELLQKDIDYINRKLELTKVFRDNINNMGWLVAGRYLNKIEVIATENYRRISGNNDILEWKSYENNPYMVYLKSNNNYRKFEQLSGGEQVTVAIALRSAMASLLTKANFAIFDEPTNNLDFERRIALAESLKEILKNLKQAIIVTHDESFREMAQNIITLSDK